MIIAALIDSFTDSILRFLARVKREDQHSGGTSLLPTEARSSAGLQPAAQVLDKFQEREIFRKDALPITGENPAPESTWMLADLLKLGCETVVDSNKYGPLVCGSTPLGICKHCGLPICGTCQKYECCTAEGHDRHELLQPEFATKVSV